MSNIFSHTTGNSNRKVIQLRPIDVVKDERATEENLEDEYTSLQEKIRLVQEQIQLTEQQKEQMIAEAVAEINQEKENWQEEKQVLMKQAQEEGYNNGYAAGKQDSIAQYQQLLDQANTIIDSATKDYHSTIEQSEEEIVNLAIHTAEKIIKQKLIEDPLSILPIVNAAIKEIKDQSRILIYLHPDNYEFVVGQKDELIRLVDTDAKLSIYANAELKVDSCLIEHPFGKIDASVDTQLSQLRKVLHEIVGGDKQ